MKVFVTKYATTKGVYAEEVSEPSEFGYVRVHGPRYQVFRLGKEAFCDEAEAESDRIRRIKAKIVSLESQIKKLSALIA